VKSSTRQLEQGSGGETGILRRRENLRLPSFGRDQQFQRLAHRDVVSDNEHDGTGCGTDDDLQVAIAELSLCQSRGSRAGGLQILSYPQSASSARAAPYPEWLDQALPGDLRDKRDGCTVFPSPCAVMKTIGISWAGASVPRCRSGSLRQAIAKSRIRQVAAQAVGGKKLSSAAHASVANKLLQQVGRDSSDP